MGIKLPQRKNLRLQGFDYRHPGFYFVTICTKNGAHLLGEIDHGKMHLSECGKIAREYWKQIPLHTPEASLDEFVIMPNHLHGIIRILDPEGRNEGFPFPFKKIDYEAFSGEYYHFPSSEPSLCPASSPKVWALQCNARTLGEDSISSLQREDSISSLQREDSISSLQREDSISSLQREDSISSLQREDDISLLPEYSSFEINLESEIKKKIYPPREPGKCKAMAEISPKKGSLSVIIRTYKAAVSYDLHKWGTEFAWHRLFYDRIILNPDELEQIRWYIRLNPKRWKKDMPRG